MDGTITFEDGTREAVPETVTPFKEYETLAFTADIWNFKDDIAMGTQEGQAMIARLPLSDFTPVIPQYDDIFTFKVSGTTNKEMKWFGFHIYCRTYNPHNYQAIGGANGWQSVNFSGTFVEELSSKNLLLLELIVFLTIPMVNLV